MNARARDALVQAVTVKDPEERLQAVEAWSNRWIVAAEQRVRVSDTHPRVVALELAHATRAMVEQIALTGATEKVLQIEPPNLDPSVKEYVIEMTCLRYSAPPALGLVPKPPKRKRKRRST